MNEVTRIRLARVTYEIDLGAKAELDAYLKAIKKNLGAEVDAMEDIEIRMTEILASRGVVKDGVITENDIEVIKTQMGQPKSFSEDDDEDEKGRKKGKTGEFTRGKNNQNRVNKKFYRDTDNAVLGGVIAGLSAYTGIDVTLLRVIFVVLVIVPSFGTMILVYIVIWIVAPAATTVSEKLEMRDEPVDIESIKNSAKDVAEKVKNTGEEIVEKIKTPQKKTDEADETSAERGDAGERRENQVGTRVFRTIFKVIGVFGVVISSIVLAAFVFAMAAIIVMFFAVDMPAKPLFMVAVILALNFVLLMIMLVIGLFAALISGKLGRGLKISLLVSFILLMGTSIASGAWLSITGREGVERTVEVIQNEQVLIDVDTYDEDGQERTRVKVGPLKIDVKNK